MIIKDIAEWVDILVIEQSIENGEDNFEQLVFAIDNRPDNNDDFVNEIVNYATLYYNEFALAPYEISCIFYHKIINGREQVERIR